eukprot:234659-Amphidinium_carterae.1
MQHIGATDLLQDVPCAIQTKSTQASIQGQKVGRHRYDIMRLHGQKWKELTNCQRSGFEKLAEHKRATKAKEIQDGIVEEQEQLKHALQVQVRMEVAANDSMVQRARRYDQETLNEWEKAVCSIVSTK